MSRVAEIGWDRLGSWHCSHIGELRLLSFRRLQQIRFGMLWTSQHRDSILLLHIAPHRQIVPLVILQTYSMLFLFIYYKWIDSD